MPEGSHNANTAGQSYGVDAPGTGMPPPLTVGIIGVGTMGKGITRLFAQAGHHVRAYDGQPGLVDAWLASLPDDDPLAASGDAHVRAPASIAETVADCDLVVEVVAEDRAVKSALFAEISQHAPTDAVLATNTSSFPIDELAEDVVNPSRFLGTHFFNPAELIPGVEVIPGSATSPERVAQVKTWLTDAGKRPAVVHSSPGFIANRLQMALFLECLKCVDEGLVSHDDLDTVVSTSFGFRLPLYGPFAIADMAGLDVYKSILETLEAGYGERFSAPLALLAATDAGNFGVKTGKGFRSYDESATAKLLAERDRMYVRMQDLQHQAD